MALPFGENLAPRFGEILSRQLALRRQPAYHLRRPLVLDSALF
jgi:hypothetical protein